MSEALGDGLAVNACLQGQSGVRVPQVIQLDLREQRLLHRLPPVAPERLGVESSPFSRVKSRTVWSFSAGARLSKYGIPLELQVDLLNAFDVRGLYNFQSVFGGTHVIPPRTLAGRVKFVF